LSEKCARWNRGTTYKVQHVVYDAPENG
jgi:hypothetical protein